MTVSAMNSLPLSARMYIGLPYLANSCSRCLITSRAQAGAHPDACSYRSHRWFARSSDWSGARHCDLTDPPDLLACDLSAQPCDRACG